MLERGSVDPDGVDATGCDASVISGLSSIIRCSVVWFVWIVLFSFSEAAVGAAGVGDVIVMGRVVEGIVVTGAANGKGSEGVEKMNTDDVAEVGVTCVAVFEEEAIVV